MKLPPPPLLLTATLVLLSPVLQGAAPQLYKPLQYGSGLQDTRWSISGSIFECYFVQPIAGFGEARFYQRAGESLTFQLKARNNLMDYSKAEVSLVSPPWRPSEQPENLGSTSINRSGPLLSLDSRRANIFLHGLMEGRRPTISQKTFYDANRFVQVYVSPSGFATYYPEFLNCRNQLLTVNFDQIARSKVLFGVGEDKLDKRDLETLDRIIYYLRRDPRVKAVYLDGHSDNGGRRYDNRQISKRRVDNVEQYLLQKGIDPAMITSRFHGDRYPIASNKTAAGRAENRRVTIRLEMGEDRSIPPELVFKSRYPPDNSTQADSSSSSSRAPPASKPG